MEEVLPEIDRDYYRSVRLLFVRAELEQLREWPVDFKRWGKIPLRMARSPDSYGHLLMRAGIVQSFSRDVNIGG
jgi:hypothetical protein